MAVPQAFITAFSGDEPVVIFFTVEAYFDSGAVRLWTGSGEREISGETFYGAGNLLSIGGVERTGEVIARGMNIALSGISAELIRYAIDEPYSGRRCSVSIGIEGVAATHEIFRGFIDTMNIDETAIDSKIIMTVEHELVDLLKEKTRRYTVESQKERYPGDLAFEFVNSLNEDIEWGGN